MEQVTNTEAELLLNLQAAGMDKEDAALYCGGFSNRAVRALSAYCMKLSLELAAAREDGGRHRQWAEHFSQLAYDASGGPLDGWEDWCEAFDQSPLKGPFDGE